MEQRSGIRASESLTAAANGAVTPKISIGGDGLKNSPTASARASNRRSTFDSEWIFLEQAGKGQACQLRSASYRPAAKRSG